MTDSENARRDVLMAAHSEIVDSLSAGEEVPLHIAQLFLGQVAQSGVVPIELHTTLREAIYAAATQDSMQTQLTEILRGKERDAFNLLTEFGITPSESDLPSSGQLLTEIEPSIPQAVVFLAEFTEVPSYMQGNTPVNRHIIDSINHLDPGKKSAYLTT